MLFDYEGFDPDLAYEVQCEAKEIEMMNANLNAKAIEDHLDALIEMKEMCEDEYEDDYVDGKIHQLLRQLMPLQFAEMRRIEAMVPCADLF